MSQQSRRHLRKISLKSNVTLLIQEPRALTGQIVIDLDHTHGEELAWLLSRYQNQHAPKLISAEDAVMLAIMDAADTLREIEISEGKPHG
jgi:hypothetical protein